MTWRPWRKVVGHVANSRQLPTRDPDLLISTAGLPRGCGALHAVDEDALDIGSRPRRTRLRHNPGDRREKQNFPPRDLARA
jgi:hypothetical protein